VDFPDELDVVIEVPRFGFIKRRDDGGIDFISPAPCPFNYGSVPGTRSGDGDRLDAVVLGPRRARGTRVASAKVLARVRFLDAGMEDPKYVCSDRPLTVADELVLVGFFATYARARRLLNLARRKRGPTRYEGIERRP
jgi:inorganic pyrophosphatase